MGGWEETQLGQVTQSDQRDIPDHARSCSVDKVDGRRVEGGIWGMMVFVFTASV